MNRGLLGALTVVLAMVAWLQTQGDDDELTVVRQAGPGGTTSSTRAEAGGRARAASPAPVADPAAPPWVEAAVIQGAQAWAERHHAPLPRREVSLAWGPALPPAAPPSKPPPPVEVAVVPPPAPVAPRFPHALVGRFNDGAVVSGADATWVVRPGDVIEGQWRVDKLDGRRMSLTYLPLNLIQQVVMR